MLKVHFINTLNHEDILPWISFLKRYLDPDIRLSAEKPEIVFTSVFGDREKIFDYFKKNPGDDYVKVFFTGESTRHGHHTQYQDHLLEAVDISLGFKPLEHPRYLRFPLWLWTPMPDKYFFQILGGDHFQKLSRYNFLEFKKKFCCILSRHDLYRTRTDIFNRLSRYERVDSGSTWKRNLFRDIDTGRPAAITASLRFAKRVMNSFWYRTAVYKKKIEKNLNISINRINPEKFYLRETSPLLPLLEKKTRLDKKL